MNYRIDAEGGQPAYIQLYRQLVADITAGVYTAGQKLPSKRTVAEECGQRDYRGACLRPSV